MSEPDLIAQARTSEEHLGRLLEEYRGYLRLLARVEIGRRLQGKVDASDLVQETFLEAHRHFERFEGTSERQLTHWLRQILATRVANLVRHFLGTRGRDVRLEQELERDLTHSASQLGVELAASVSSPSQQAVRREQAVQIASALEQLPPDYREVILLRHLQGLSFKDVAERMQRSVDSVEKLWIRALTRLRQEFGAVP